MSDKIGKWKPLFELSDVELLQYIRGTEAQIKFRQRALNAAETEARQRRLIPNENDAAH